MKFRANTADLLQALGVASVVTPRPVTPQGVAGFLFVVREGRCSIYSRDAVCVARADLPISDVEGEGSFAYPASYVDAFRFVGDEVTIEATADGERFMVRYESGSGASGEHATFDPVLLSTCDTDYDRAGQPAEFPSGLLREAIQLARPFLAKPNDTRVGDEFKGLLLFDASKPDWARGDGHLFTSNAVQAFFFHCEAFAGKGFEIHGVHLPALIAFLAKSEGPIGIRRGDNYLFASNSQGHVLGWPRHSKTHGKFSYYPLKTDKYVLAVSKAVLVNALKYTRTELDAKRDKIKIDFDPAAKSLTFGVSEGTSKARSFPVPVRPLTTQDAGFSLSANIDHLMDLVEGVKGNEVELRIAIIEADPAKKVLKDIAMFRTVDEFQMTPEGRVVVETEGTYKCKVTRFVPSKD